MCQMQMSPLLLISGWFGTKELVPGASPGSSANVFDLTGSRSSTTATTPTNALSLLYRVLRQDVDALDARVQGHRGLQAAPGGRKTKIRHPLFPSQTILRISLVPRSGSCPVRDARCLQWHPQPNLDEKSLHLLCNLVPGDRVLGWRVIKNRQNYPTLM